MDVPDKKSPDLPSPKADQDVAGAERAHPALGRLLVLLPLLFFVALAVLFFSRILSGDDISQVPSVLINKPVPAFSLAGLPGLSAGGDTGPGLATADLKGRVSLVNVFASWCVPCRQEHPLLMALSERDDLDIMGINHKDQPENALSFLAELGNPYSRVGVDRDGRASIEWGVYGIPETFVVDAEGCVRAKHIGPLTEAALSERLLPMIDALQQGTGQSPC